VSDAPIFGPVIGSCIAQESVEPITPTESVVKLLGSSVAVLQMGPAMEPTPNEEQEPVSTTTTIASTTTNISAAAPNPTLSTAPSLSASATPFVPADVNGITNGPTSANSDFYISPRVVVTSAGEVLSRGHHVGFWPSYAGFNLWSNPVWTRFQAIHVIYRVLRPKPPTENYTSLVFSMSDNTAAQCFNHVVNWIALKAGLYMRMRTVAVSIVGSAYSLSKNSTAIVFTLRFPEDSDVTVYKYSNYTMSFASCEL
jgi:hypothetical protein